MPKQSDTAWVSSDFFSSPSVLGGGWIPTWIRRIRAKISTMSVAGGGVWIGDSWRDVNSLDNLFLSISFCW